MIPGFSLSFFHSFILFCHGSRRCGGDGGGGGGTGRRCSSSSCCSRSRCWLAGWLVPPLFFSPNRSRFSYTLYAWFVNLFSPHRSRFSYASYDVSFYIITIDRTEEQEETRRIGPKRHRYLYCPFCMPSAILNTRSIFFFKYVHSSASSKKAIKQEKKRREKR
jgi:hypothetical protein